MILKEVINTSFFIPIFLSIKKPHPKMRFLIGGGGGIRTLVQLILSDKDYMFRSRFFIPSEINGSYFDIVTNNCVEFTFVTVAL